MDSVTAGVIGVAGAIAGYSFRVIEGWLRARWDRDREREARREVTQSRLDDIQRQNLLDIQERLAEWMRAQTQVFLADSDTLRTTGRLRQLPKGVSDVDVETGRRLMYLTERVRDDDLRAMLTGLRQRGAEREAYHAVYHESVTGASIEATWFELVNMADAVQTRVGAVLRSFL
jgi:hypothetical protein